MKTRGAHKHQASKSADTLHTPVVPQLPPKIRLLLKAAVAGGGAAQRMTLADWRDLEREIKRKSGHQPTHHPRPD